MVKREVDQALPVSGIVVAGGQSRRMGQDKRQLRLWGARGPMLLEHTIALLSAICHEVIVVLNDPESWPGLPARVVGDVYPDGGALGGIYSGLGAAQYEHALVVAADMPLLNPVLLRWMLSHPRDYDVLVPRLSGLAGWEGRARNRLGVETLHAIYSRACLVPMSRQLEAGNPQVIGFFGEVRVAVIEPAEIAAIDPQGHSFRNVNTPDELQLVRNLLRESTVE